jgi:monofunctional chorismate mutase
MRFRGIRGATIADANTEPAILDATAAMLREMASRNEVDPDDIAGIMFSVTSDLNAAFPAEAARSALGWRHVPMMCTQEIPVPGALGRCVRVLMFVNTTKTADEIRHVYLRGAERLRPDLAPADSRAGRDAAKPGS